ncbi:MAG: His Kinase (Phospho-acceptor) protein [Verrucomicrobia bacterium]|nr:His Kinase (Phospho-acceptor) protein [Verrucomicrobiota bacterium]
MSTPAIPSLRHSPAVRYAVSILTVTGAVVVTHALQSLTPRIPTASLVFCAAIFSGWFGGLGPGLLAATISSAAIGFHLLPSPYPNSTLLGEIPRLLVFSVAVFFVSVISGRQRQAEEALERARDELEERVQDRTAELKRTNEDLQAEIAERKVAETALHTMQAELAHVSRVTMMGELTASIAHEVNQPLGAIMNYANACRRLLASNQEEKAGVDQALAKIVEDAHRASDVIARIRALSKKKPTEMTSAAVKDLVDDVLAITRHEMIARGVTARVDLATGMPRLEVDRIQLQQVLLNLIINGMEAMESSPPKNRVIEITARSGQSEGEPGCMLDIRDHGTGVPAGFEGRLFAPFYSTKSEGLGLGLAISRSIVESHGGRLALVPNGGEGATFQIFLPLKSAAVS